MIRGLIMKTDTVTTMIKRVYGKKYRLDTYQQVAPRPQYYISKIQPFIGLIKEKRVQILSVILLAIIAGGSIYYFNLLVQTEQDVLASRGKVGALMQRRNDISINLSKAVFDYSRHERSVFTTVVALRSFLKESGVKGAELEELMKQLESTGMADEGKITEKLPKAGPLSALNRLLAIFEQYPDLKLSSNFNNFMTALIEVEKDLAMERIRYNDSVNMYTTTLAQFPINFYAWIFSFKQQPYYEATGGAERFKPIDY